MNTEMLSVWSSMFMELSPEEAVETFLRCGLAATELSYEHAAVLLKRGSAAGAGSEFRSYIDNRGFSIPQAHLDFVTCDPADPDPAARRHHIDSLKEQIELFAVLGVRAMVLHSGGRKARAAGWTAEQTQAVALESFRELGEQAAKFGVTICLENMYGENYELQPAYSSADLLRIIDRIGSPQFGICLDTGHLALSKAEPHDVFIRNCGKTLKALHIADNFGVKDDHRLPYIGNSVDWVKTAAALRETGYDGLINFEIPGERGCPRPVLEDKTRFARKLGETIFLGKFTSLNQLTE
ncbi:sugar phosphate isomerase/epimerase family protein [Victivallis lenta]|nr:sugar phosphate isomerase/epimerase family protein [Victivallis lenta]